VAGCRAAPPAREDLRRESERLRKENQRLRERVAESDKQIADRDRRIADQEKQIGDLERQLASRGALWAKDSTKPSEPPSSDGSAATRRLKPARWPRGRPGRHKPGG
jgi:septal ring factor EnvC (AmiA/AmiB activator)